MVHSSQPAHNHRKRIAYLTDETDPNESHWKHLIANWGIDIDIHFLRLFFEKKIGSLSNV